MLRGSTRTSQCTVFPAQPYSCRRQHPQLCLGEGISLPASSGLTPTFPHCQPHLPLGSQLSACCLLFLWNTSLSSYPHPHASFTPTPSAAHQGRKNILEASSHSAANHARGNTCFPWPSLSPVPALHPNLLPVPPQLPSQPPSPAFYLP